MISVANISRVELVLQLASSDSFYRAKKVFAVSRTSASRSCLCIR